MSSVNVKVVVRFRPLSKKEIEKKYEKTVKVEVEKGQVIIFNPKAQKEAPRTFTFDQVYDWSARQIDVYNQIARPLVVDVMDGYNGTIFAYGQTGSGKTFTMEGVSGDPELRGIIPNTFEHIFDDIKVIKDKSFLVRASYLELYNEEIRDLLSKTYKTPLQLKEHPETGVYVKDLSSYVVKSVPEIEKVMNSGKGHRVVAATEMNADSSRSHAIFTITIETSESDDAGTEHIRAGKLNLVDLAGSERQSKTKATGLQEKEGIRINMSLSTLGNVISALADGKSKHIPYRDSKLTRLLQNSLGGNAKTIMIAAAGPADYNYDETMSTLRYANRAKNIKNKAKINEDPKDAMLRQYREEIEKLKSLLQQKAGAGSGQPIIIKKKKAKSGKKKRRRTKTAGEGGGEGEEGGSGEEEDEESEEEEEGEGEEGLTENQIEMMKAQEERVNLEIQKKLMAVGAALDVKGQEELKAQLETTMLEKQLQEMQAKLIVGGENLLDKQTAQAAHLRAQEMELEKQKEREKELARQIAEEKERELLAKEYYASIQDEIESKDMKLKKIWADLSDLRNEFVDIEKEAEQERADLIAEVNALSSELKLKITVLQQFVPPEEEERIEANSHYNEDSGEWLIACVSYAGKTVNRGMKPMQEGADETGTGSYPLELFQTGLIGRPIGSNFIEQLGTVYYTYSEDATTRKSDDTQSVGSGRSHSSSSSHQGQGKSARIATATTSPAARPSSARKEASFPVSRGQIRSKH